MRSLPAPLSKINWARVIIISGFASLTFLSAYFLFFNHLKNLPPSESRMVNPIGKKTAPEPTKEFSNKFLSFTYPISFLVKEREPIVEAVAKIIDTNQKRCIDLINPKKTICLREGVINIQIHKKSTDIETFNQIFYDGWEAGITPFGDCVKVKGGHKNTFFKGLPAIENSFVLTSEEIKNETCTNQNNWALNKDYFIKSYAVAKGKYIYALRISSENDSEARKKLDKIIESLKIKP